MAGRSVLYVMPSVAVVAMAALVLGPGRERPATGARVWGVPADGARVLALRLETMERQYGSDRAMPVDPIDVTIAQGGKTLGSWTGSSGDDGVAEVRIETAEPLAGQVEVRASSGRRALADGVVTLGSIEPLRFEERAVEGKAEGDVKLAVSIARGVLAAPFAGVVRVKGTVGGAPATGELLALTVQGADLDEDATKGLVLDANGEASIVLTPTWHSVELRISAASQVEHGEPQGSWQGGLPVQPGALWLRMRGDVAEVLSPVPRDRIYVSALGERGRVLGAIVPVQKDASGFYVGTLPLADVTRLGAAAMTLAGDPEELGSGTVTFPIARTVAVKEPPRVAMLIDGVPFAERIEKKRAALARMVSVGVAFLAAVFEAILLVLVSRESQAKLAAHLAAASEDADDRAAAARMTVAPASRAITLVALVGIVLLSFGAVAAFAVVR